VAEVGEPVSQVRQGRLTRLAAILTCPASIYALTVGGIQNYGIAVEQGGSLKVMTPARTVQASTTRRPSEPPIAPGCWPSKHCNREYVAEGQIRARKSVPSGCAARHAQCTSPSVARSKRSFCNNPDRCLGRERRSKPSAETPPRLRPGSDLRISYKAPLLCWRLGMGAAESDANASDHHTIADSQNRVGDGDHRPLASAYGGKTAELCGEIAVLGLAATQAASHGAVVVSHEFDQTVALAIAQRAAPVCPPPKRIPLRHQEHFAKTGRESPMKSGAFSAAF